MDFAVRCPLVRHWRLLSGFCPSTHTFAPRFLQTSPHDDSPCALLALHLHQVGQGTFTPKLLSMPSTRRGREAAHHHTGGTPIHQQPRFPAAGDQWKSMMAAFHELWIPMAVCLPPVRRMAGSGCSRRNFHGRVPYDRIHRYARWHAGRCALWTARRRRTGRGEGSSGLRFDVLSPG
jgi:hypothetical protein